MPYEQADKAFLLALREELTRARIKFPSSNLSMAALTEEVGELAQAMLKRRAGKGSHSDIFGEAVQVAAMAMRVAIEGDPSFNALPYREP